MPAVFQGGINFTVPSGFQTDKGTSARIALFDDTSALTTAGAGFWTEIGERGVAVNTDWTADTYKTLLNVSSGKTKVAALIGPEAGGSETHTVRWTIDGGAAVEQAFSVSSGERVLIHSGALLENSYSTTNVILHSGADLNAAKTIGTLVAQFYIPPHHICALNGTPQLQSNISLLVEMKSSANITATANQERQAGIMYRSGL